jgi:activator of Hsp90 ATPase-like protein
MTADSTRLSLEIEEKVLVGAPIEAAYEALMYRMAEGNKGEADAPMPMVLERRPGGRWFRDLGNDAGHLWGHVQAIRPPTLLEVYGPLFMSLPVANNLIIRLEEVEGGTEITLRQTASGPVEEDWEEGVREGWKSWLEDVREDCKASV